MVTTAPFHAADQRTGQFAIAAACWAIVFALFHLTWASGWYILLDPVFALRAFAQPGFLTYDLVVAALCIGAAVVALAFVAPWGRRAPRWLLGGLAWIGTGVLVLRSAVSLAQHGYLLFVGRLQLSVMSVWEVWFYLGSVLFLVSTWRYWRSSRGAT
jgi:hypothetical protein